MSSRRRAPSPSDAAPPERRVAPGARGGPGRRGGAARSSSASGDGVAGARTSRRRASPPAPPRAQSPTPFTAILARLCEATSARGVAFVDHEGETVDHAGDLDDFGVKVAAAEWQIVVSRLREAGALGLDRTVEFTVRARGASYFVRTFDEGYSLVVVAARRTFALSERALGQAEHELRAEAGLPRRSGLPSWRGVEVRVGAGGRPEALLRDSAWLSVEVMGRVAVGLGSRERGFRVRLRNGAEVTLVRERLGRWYAEDLP